VPLFTHKTTQIDIQISPFFFKKLYTKILSQDRSFLKFQVPSPQNPQICSQIYKKTTQVIISSYY